MRWGHVKKIRIGQKAKSILAQVAGTGAVVYGSKVHRHTKAVQAKAEAETRQAIKGTGRRE